MLTLTEIKFSMLKRPIGDPMDKDSLVFLEGLCNAYGPSGFERNVTLLIKDRLEGYAKNMITDRMGTMVFSAGGPSDGPTILVPGHVDEVGMLISSISPEGYLTFLPSRGLVRPGTPWAEGKYNDQKRVGQGRNSFEATSYHGP